MYMNLKLVTIDFLAKTNEKIQHLGYYFRSKTSSFWYITGISIPNKLIKSIGHNDQSSSFCNQVVFIENREL